jgi:DNA modification methylase
MTPEEFVALKADIRENGQIDDIMLHEGKILDGRHRYAACLELNIKPRFKTFSGTSTPLQFICSRNTHRHLTDSQKAAAAVRIMQEFSKAATPRSRANLKRGGLEGKPVSSREGKSADKAGELFGVSGGYVIQAQFVLKHDPDLFGEVFLGEKLLSRARREVQQAIKLGVLKAKAKAACASPLSTRWQIIKGDCLAEMEKMPGNRFRLIFADPPYNEGVDYGSGKKADSLMPEAYLAECEKWMAECARLLTPDGSLWVMISEDYADHFGMLLRQAGLHRRRWVVWHETFGNCSSDLSNFSRCARHLFYVVRDPSNFIFNGVSVRVKSARQTKYRDKRASAGGKSPDNVWAFPRIVGNASERTPGLATQLPVKMLERIVLACSDPGDNVLDPFCKTGTTGEACIKTGRIFTGIEKNSRTVTLGQQRLKVASAGI